MYEIELKAHVANKNSVEKKLNSFAIYKGKAIKQDSYFQFEKSKDAYLSCRIRDEKITNADGPKFEHSFLTYKLKEKKQDLDGCKYEVNVENKTELSNPDVIIKLLLDTGYKKAYTKQKNAKQWNFQTEYGNANLELCNIPNLGDFLEIEIVTDFCDNEIQIREELKNLILKSGLLLSDIEGKYYSELLALARKG